MAIIELILGVAIGLLLYLLAACVYKLFNQFSYSDAEPALKLSNIDEYISRTTVQQCNQCRKEPNAVLDYSWNWNAWLAAVDPDDTISAHQIILANSVSADVDRSSEDNGIVTAWISGGEAGEKIAATCRITTTRGRIDDRTFYLKIMER